MHRIRQYPSQVEAMAAVFFLREHSIVARAANSPTLTMMAGPLGAWDILIDRRDQSSIAEALLDEFDTETPRAIDAEDQRPDLSCANASLAPPCPSCGVVLPMDASCDCCPGCRAPIDVTALIVQAHGPEALVNCYPDTKPVFDPTQFEVSCSECGYELIGLEQVGLCPECGRPYDKDAIIRSMLGIGW